MSFFFWPLCCVLHPFTDSDYPIGIFWSFYCLSDFNWRLLIAPLVFSKFGHWWSVLFQFTDSDYPFGIFWQLYCLSDFTLRLLITSLVSSNCWPLHCLSYFDLQFLIVPLVSSNFWPLHCLSFLRFTASDCHFSIFKLFIK